MRASIVTLAIGLTLVLGSATPGRAASGDMIFTHMPDVFNTMLLMSPEGRYTNAVFTASGSTSDTWFTVLSTISADLPPVPFKYRVLNLRIPAPPAGALVPTVVADAIRHCTQVGMVAQLQPDKMMMVVQVFASETTTFAFDPTTNWLNVGLNPPGGDFRCTLQNR